MRGEGGRGTERLAAEGDGVAPVGLVEALRVGSAMLCPQGVMGDAVAPKRWLSRPPPVAGGHARRGGRALGAAEGDDVAATAMAEALRVGSAMLCPQGAMGNAVAPKHPKWRSPPPVAVTACATGATSVGAAAGDGEVVGAFQPREESA